MKTFTHAFRNKPRITLIFNGLIHLPMRDRMLTLNDLKNLYDRCAENGQSCDECGPKCCDGLHCRRQKFLKYLYAGLIAKNKGSMSKTVMNLS